MAQTGDEPLSAERLHEIRVKAYDAYDWDDWKARAMLGEMLTEHDRLIAEVERQRAAPTQSYYQLLEQRLSDKGDEVERLRAREAALVEVVERMASGPHWAIDLYTLQQQARALLAEEG